MGDFSFEKRIENHLLLYKKCLFACKQFFIKKKFFFFSEFILENTLEKKDVKFFNLSFEINDNSSI